MEEFLKLDRIDQRLITYIAQFDVLNLDYVIEYHASLYKVRGINLDQASLKAYVIEQRKNRLL